MRQSPGTLRVQNARPGLGTYEYVRHIDKAEGKERAVEWGRAERTS